MRRMIANAAPWSMALKEAYMADFGEDSLWEVYGSTELGVDTALAPADQRRKPGSCGRARARRRDPPVRRRGPGDRPSPACPARCSCARAAALVGYYKADDKFRAARRDDGFISVGDVAFRDDGGLLLHLRPQDAT